MCTLKVGTLQRNYLPRNPAKGFHQHAHDRWNGTDALGAAMPQLTHQMEQIALGHVLDLALVSSAYGQLRWAEERHSYV